MKVQIVKVTNGTTIFWCSRIRHNGSYLYAGIQSIYSKELTEFEPLPDGYYLCV
jgi:hypothetical protein